MKHYMGYGVPVSGKDRTPSSISRSDMREKHFAPYLEAVRQGALSVMVNSGVDNGMPFHANKEYLTKWLKEDLNWDGMIVTDWADINNLCTRDHIAATKKEAIKIAINAGIDMSMVPYEVSFCDYLKELVEEGEVPMSRIDDAVARVLRLKYRLGMSRIDDAVARVLRLKYRLGLFDKPYWSTEDYPKFGSEEFAQVALQAAEESEVLLQALLEHQRLSEVRLGRVRTNGSPSRRRIGSIAQERRRYPSARQGQEDSLGRTERQLHAVPERRLVVQLARTPCR